MKQEAVCNVFKFQVKDEDFGYIALRLQFSTLNKIYNSQRKERLVCLNRELKICLGKANRGSMSESISEANSHKDTFISEAPS